MNQFYTSAVRTIREKKEKGELSKSIGFEIENQDIDVSD
jgi:hypothetical protein